MRISDWSSDVCSSDLLSNAAFARVVEPDNPALMRRIEEAQAMRQSGRPTLPSPLAVECATNLFLRIDVPAVRAAIAEHAGQVADDRVEAFAALRRWKAEIGRTSGRERVWQEG